MLVSRILNRLFKALHGFGTVKIISPQEQFTFEPMYFGFAEAFTVLSHNS